MQRKMLCIGDMVYGGSGEGPLSPDSVKSGNLIISDSIVQFDAVCASLMGFSPEKIPTVNSMWRGWHTTVASNDSGLDGRHIEEIRKTMSKTYKPAKGWESLST